MADTQASFLTYKGKPIVRKGNTIYYGNMSDPFVIMLSITSTKTFNDMEVADRVLIQLLNQLVRAYAVSGAGIADALGGRVRAGQAVHAEGHEDGRGFAAHAEHFADGVFGGNQGKRLLI